jgi:choline dehydrogenase
VLKNSATKKVLDFNGSDMVGFGALHATNRNGRRRSTAKSFLSPAKDRPKLHIAKFSLITKIMIEPGTKQTRGLQVRSKQGDYPRSKFLQKSECLASCCEAPPYKMH